MKLFSVIAASVLLFTSPTLANPVFDTIGKASDLMGPSSPDFPVDKEWSEIKKLVEGTSYYKEITDKIANALCSSDYNKSVLLIGESTDDFKYIFAQMAIKNIDCKNYWHFNIDQGSLIADHTYVGQMEGFWKKHISEPAASLSIVYYLDNLFPVLGLGTTRNHPTGLESIVAKDVRSGKINMVTFIDKTSLEKARSLGYSYVIDSFQTQIFIDPLKREQVLDLARRKIKSTSELITYDESDLIYLNEQLSNFQPNVSEPSRTINAVTRMLNNVRSNFFKISTQNLNYCFDKTQAGEYKKTISDPNAQKIQIKFSNVNLDNYFTNFKILDSNTGAELHEIQSMQNGSWLSPVFETNSVTLIYKVKASITARQICVDYAKLTKEVAYNIGAQTFRQALLDSSNVPEWLVSEDYSRLRNLESELNKKIIGAKEAKKTITRLAKSAYLTNRNDDKPLATVLLAGPTGTGKSFSAKVFSKSLGLKRIVFDMTAYQTPYDVNSFVKELTTQLAVYPWGMYLLKKSIKPIQRY